MKSALWLGVGVGIGFLIAHRVDRTARGRAFFAGLDSRTREFTDGIVDGYRSREAELRETPDGDDAQADDARSEEAPSDDERADDAAAR